MTYNLPITGTGAAQSASVTAHETAINDAIAEALLPLGALGTAVGPAAQRTALGATTAGSALFTAADAAAQRSSLGLAGAMTVETAWNPTGGLFPGSGAARKGALYRVTGFAATVDGVRFELNDVIFALVDNASTSTYAGNWHHIPGNQFRALQQAIVAQLSIAGADEGAAVDFDGLNVITVSPDGTTGLTLGPNSLILGANDATLPGVVPDGLITNIRRVGDYWQFSCDGVQYTCYTGLGDFHATIPDSPEIMVNTYNGQSWNTQERLTADLNNEDPSGRIRRNFETFQTCDYVVVRADGDFSPRVPWDNRIYHRRAYSTDTGSGASGPITGLRAWKSSGATDFYTIGDIAGITQQSILRDMRQPRKALVGFQCGMAGQSEDKFLKPGSSWAGTGGTVTASNVAGQARSFWENDAIARAGIESVVRSQWFDRRVTYDVQVFDQGGAGVTQTVDDSHFRNFLNAFRADVDSLALPTSDGGKQHILTPQGFAASKEASPGWQPIDQLRWAQANASGRDWLAGPAYQWPLLQESVGQSAIHGTAMHNLRKGEMIGLAIAYLESPKIGSWQPFWIVDATIAGSLITVTVNNPRASIGLPVFDTTTIGLAANNGFRLTNVSGGVVSGAIGLGAVTIVNATTITIVVAGSLSGVTAAELSYAALRGTSQPDAVVGQGTRSACWGNIKKVGRHIGPITEEPIDLWLCSYGKVFNF